MKKRIPFFALVVGLILIMTGFLVFNHDRQPLDLTSALAAEIKIEPTQYDSAGVDCLSQFVVKSSTHIDSRVLAQNISIEPEIKFSVEEEKNNEILLIPEEPLETNKLYRFTLGLTGSDPLKWAFQTKGEFKINGTLPRDRATGVPTNTGIEITFSHEGFGDLEKYFEISPKAEGHFEIHKKTVVFVPDHLEPGTVYTIKAKKGLKLADSDLALAEDYVFQFETQDPAQHNQTKDYFEFFTNTMEFAEATAPVIPLGFYRINTEESPEVKVTLYQYQDADDYIESIEKREKVPYWAYYSRREYKAETNDLREIQSFTVNLKRYNGEYFLEFPETLKAGYYLSQVTLGSITRQIWLEVTDLAVYTTVGENKTLVWVNNLADGKPVTNATVTLLGSEQRVLTNAQGLAEISTPPLEDDGLYVTVHFEDQEAVAPVKPDWLRFVNEEKGANGLAARDYWKYLYLDRELYKPNDTVHFWGLVKGRQKDIEDSQKLTVALTKWQSGRDENVVLEENEVDLANNVFTGEIKLPDVIPGYYYLTVKLDGLNLIQHGFEVGTFTKPAYRIDVEPEKKAIFAGETVKFNIAASCFEGTPVPNVPLRYNLESSGELVTDEKGQAVFSYTPEYRSEQYVTQDYHYLYLNANFPESGEISTGSSIIVLNNDIDINAEGKITGQFGKINIEVDKLSVNKVNRGEMDPWEENAFVSGKGAGLTVTVSLFRQEWDKIEDGEYYDFINKTVVKKYRYQERRVPLGETKVVTDRDGKAEYSFPVGDKKSYWVQLTALDGKNNQSKTEIYLSGGGYPEYNAYSWYYLEDEKAQGWGKYQEGDEVLLTLKNNENKVADRKDGFLFYNAQAGIRDCWIQDSGTYRAEFKEKDVPNYWVKGVYFDGRVYHETNEYIVALDEQQKELDIKIMTDKKEYRPRDQVNVNLEVKDKMGRPVAATVNLNLVDEALFMLSPQHVNTLASIYGDFLPSGVWVTASTHQDLPNYFGGGAEKGGEGGSGRQDFKDTAFFETLTTGRDGKASALFTLPDNLTSWRLTYQAVTKDLEGASGTAKIKVRLPFFVDMVLNDKYLAKDRPVINLRSLGTGLDEKEEVTFQVRLTRNEEKQEIYNETIKGNAFTTLPVSLPSLGEGEYQITVVGTGGGFKDTLTCSFQVVKSYMTQEKIDYQLLTAETKILADTTKPVTLTFTDAGRSEYLSLLCSLAQVEGIRVEQKLVPMLAKELLKEYFPEFKYIPSGNDMELSSYQTPEGGVAILPYGDSDLEVSAKIASWAKDHFDMAALKTYFIKVINDPNETSERYIIALYGLAALGEPVLTEVESALEEKNLTIMEELYLMLSFIQLGNEQPVREMLQDLLKQNGEANGPYMQINYGKDQDDVVKATGLAALVAGRLKFDEAHMLERYVTENPLKDDLTYLEQITFLQENIQDLSNEEVSFSFVYDGKMQNITLAPGETYSLIIMPEKLKFLSFEKIQGKVGITTQYQEDFIPFPEDSAAGVVLTRNYKVKGKSTHEFRAGDLVEVEISWNIGGKAPKGLYRITDYLPSGLKLVAKPYQWGTVKNILGWPVEVEGQKVVFLVSEKGTIRYYARIVNQGIFTVENMMIQHMQNGKIYGVTELDQVEIK
ncbi:MAG: Ig-like domain-containing protein [Bacillota bacterium]